LRGPGPRPPAGATTAMAEAEPFAGFPGRGSRYTALPDVFFSRLLGRIDDPPELKALLYVFWRLRGRRGDAQFVTLSELAAIPSVLGAFGSTVEAARAALRAALEAGGRRRAPLGGVGAGGGGGGHGFFLQNPARAQRARPLPGGGLRPPPAAPPARPAPP